MTKDVHDRRPVKTRNTAWAASAAHYLRQKGFTPNSISVWSVIFALLSFLCFLTVWHIDNAWLQRGLLLLALVGIQGRLICNLLDGMVAVEGGLRSPAGAVFNELPDRLSDSLLFLGAGYGLVQTTGGVELGWAASLFALFTAYVRLLGGTCGLTQQFIGPMAKQHRMALLSAATVVAIIVPQWGETLLLAALALITMGAAWTTVRRTRNIIGALTQESAS